MTTTQSDAALAPYTTIRVGGNSRALIEVSTTDELVAVVRDCDDRDEPVLLLAGGSNLVISDEGFPGTCILIRTRGVDIEIDEDAQTALVKVAAGESWDRLVAQLVSDGISGLEALSGVPGSVGATPFQNVGAYGCEVSQFIESVEVFDRISGEYKTLTNDECGFSYRSSLFKAEPQRWLILSVTFQLAVSSESAPIQYAELASALDVSIGERAPVTKVRRSVLDIRRRKGMVVDIEDRDSWSCGSFFTNPIVETAVADALPEDAAHWTMPDGRVKVSAAWLIAGAGFEKGFALPGSQAAISSRHTLALTNRGNATAEQIIELARTIREKVSLTYGIELIPEPRMVNCSL